MIKQLIMTEEEFNKEIQKARGEGSSFMAAIVIDIFKTGGTNIDIKEDANPDVVRFINELKEIKRKLDESTSKRIIEVE